MRLMIPMACVLIFTACGEEISTPSPDVFVEDTVDIEVAPPTVSIDLRVGHMTTSGLFLEKEPTVKVPSDGALGYAQVAAKLGVPDAFDPDLLRVMFTSDRIEWMATDVDGSTYTFLSRHECIQTGLQCDDVVPGESESGYFETGGSFDERLAVANVHCTTPGLPYDLTVTAFVIDISYPVAEIVSEEQHVVIDCVAKDEE